MSETSDPYRHWDGQRWLRWDGLGWTPEVAEPALTAPTVELPTTPAVSEPPPQVPPPGPPAEGTALPPGPPLTRDESARKGMRVGRAIAAMLAFLVVGLLVGAAIGSSGKSTAVPTSTVTVTETPGAQSTDGSGSTPSAASTPTDLTQSIGSGFTSDDGQGNTYSVTLTKVTDPAKGANQFLTPAAGKRLVAARFTLVGVTGTVSDDANTTATVVGSDGQTYQPDFNDVVGCTNFNSGTFTLTAGRTSIGCVVFQIPSSVKVSQVQWSAGLFSSGAPATWQLG